MMSRDNIPQISEPDLSTTSAFKVTLPDNVFRDLSDYADALSFTKSDVIKEAIKEKISRDTAWLKRIFVFRKQEDNTEFSLDLIESLKLAKKGALIKVAGCYSDKPANADGWIFQLIKFDDEFVYIEPPFGMPATFLDTGVNDISLEKGALLVPEITISPGVLGTTITQMIYKVPHRFVWGIDCNRNPPSMQSSMLAGLGLIDVGRQ